MNKITPSNISFQENGKIPNNPDLPVLIYRKIFDTTTADKDKKFQQAFEKNSWKGVWKNGLYDYHHFHLKSHEALGIANGSADIQLGGEGGKTITVEAGDLIVLPAGTGHKRISASDNLVVIGAYPAGQEDYDICRSDNEFSDVYSQLRALSLPDSDPMYGATGPLMQVWQKAI